MVDNIGMFKAYDIRTKTESLTEQSAIALGRSVATYFANDLKITRVVICRDARLWAPKIAQLLTDCLTDVGITVLLNPVAVSTCQFYYACTVNPDCGGIMVTASHNPANYIGMKLVAPGVFPLAMDYGPFGGVAAIKEHYIKEDFAKPCLSRGRVKIVDYSDSYVQYSMKLAGVKKDSLKGLNIMAEFLSGSMGRDFSIAFEEAGCNFTPRHSIPDGNFFYGDPNPIIESSIAPAREAMKNGNFDLGFCLDGDGDRLDLMHKNGQQIVPGFNISILVPYLLELYQNAFGNKSFNPQFYYDVKAIPTAVCEIAKAGVGVHIIRNGHSFVKGKLRENFSNQYLVAEEESAHYYVNLPLCSDSWEKGYASVENTLFFALLTARAFEADPKKYERAYELQTSLYREREWPLHFDANPQMMPQIIDEVQTQMLKRGAKICSTMDDGSDLDATLIRFNLPDAYDKNTQLSDSWCQVAQRISRSEDAMTRFEVASNNQALCKEMNDAIVEIAQKYVDKGYAHF